MELADLILEARNGKAGAKEDQTSASTSTASTPPNAPSTRDASSTPGRQESPRGSEGSADKPGSPIAALQAESRAKRLERRACCIDAKDLCGMWTDSFGNNVCVYSVDAYSANLVATMSNSCRDFNLPMHRMQNGRGWKCGGATLESSSIHELHWKFPYGRTSVWKRMAAVPAPVGYVACTPQDVQGMIDTGMVNQVPNGDGTLAPQIVYTWLPVTGH